MDLKSQLHSHLSHFQAAPFLFVGSGLSRRYFWLETWFNLLGRFSKSAGLDFNYISSRANGDLPVAATLLAAEFHKIWWKAKRFQDRRRMFSKHATKLDSPLKIEIADYIKAKTWDEDDAEMIAELKVLREGTIDGIITTNWDLMLERLFPEFEVFVGQDELLFSATHAIAEIYKIHGCCTRPDSMVLTEADYKEFNDRNPYLAAKLLTIFVEHPVLFLGYSLSDPNVTAILDSITSCLRAENIGQLRDRLIIVEWVRHSSGSIESAMHNIHGKIIPVTVIKCDSFLPVYEALALNKRKFPARVLRRLKSHIYQLVKENDPQGQLYVAELGSELDSSKIEVVYGVGVAAQMGQRGYSRIRVEQVLRDVLFEENRFNPEKMVQYTLPDLLGGASKNVPVFRYLRQAGYVGSNAKSSAELNLKVQKAMVATPSTFTAPKSLQNKKAKIDSHRCGIAGLTKLYDIQHCAIFIPLLPMHRIQVDELHHFLTLNYAELEKWPSDLRKLVCLYDCLQFGPDAQTGSVSSSGSGAKD